MGFLKRLFCRKKEFIQCNKSKQKTYPFSDENCDVVIEYENDEGQLCQVTMGYESYLFNFYRKLKKTKIINMISKHQINNKP